MPLRDTLKHAAFSALARLDSSSDIPLHNIRNVLLLQHASALGSVIHATPLIPALRVAVPNARIIVAASGFASEIFRDNPGVDTLLPIPNPAEHPLAAARVLRKTLAPEQPYATITTTGNERSGIALASFLAGAGNRVGFTLVPELYRAPLTFDPSLSQIANNLRMIEALGHEPAQHHEPQVFFSDEDVAQARSLLGNEYDPAKLLAVFVTQTSPTQCKSWRPERFVAAAQFLIDNYSANIVFVGTASERQAIDAIQRSLRGTIWNLAGQTNLGQLSALLSLCDVGLTLDTGTMHLGRAVGLPMAIIAPAWSPPIEWLPLNDPRFTILKNTDMERVPEDYIIDEVSVDETTTALADLLRRYPR